MASFWIGWFEHFVWGSWQNLYPYDIILDVLQKVNPSEGANKKLRVQIPAIFRGIAGKKKIWSIFYEGLKVVHHAL